MGDALTQIGSFFGSSGGKAALGGATAGTGLLQSFLANRQAEQKQDFVKNLITNPTKFASYVKSFDQPLQAGLTADIDRNASAFGAEHGLGSSPAVMQNVEAQALAPYLQQQQQTAEQAALQSLGIYSGSPTTKPVDISSILKLLMSQPANKPNVTAGIDPNAISGLGNQTLTDVTGGGLPQTLPTGLIGDTTDSGAGAF
jgi:hypothetical protein